MDHEEIRALIRLLREEHLEEIEIEEKGKKIRVRQAGSPTPAHLPSLIPTPSPVQTTSETDSSIHVISSPIVGTFYRSHSPGAESYVQVGDRVKKGQTLCIVEAMKIMNEIESDRDGIIAAICAEDKSPVEYGQPLFHLKPVEI